MVLIDGHLPVPGLGDLPQHSFVKGDRRSRNIAAASIVAKVVRDFLMLGFHEVYPQYGFDSHKGYGTRAHLEALSRHGPSPIHRRTFAGVPGPPMPDDRIGRRR
jgi:ribonuclease HII